MTLSAAYMRSLRGDPECIEALAYLADSARPYPTGVFTPPLTARTKESSCPLLLAMLVRVSHRTLRSGGTRVRELEIADETGSARAHGESSDVAQWFAATVLIPKRHGTLVLCSDSGRHIMDIWLDSLGETLLHLGYSLQPCMSGGNIAFLVIRKGRYRWTVGTFEAATGKAVSCGLQLASIVTGEALSSRPTARHVFSAARAYAGFLRTTFGCALAPTAGMTAMSAARYFMAPDFRKWRPEPLRVAFEREGKGYRGGITFAQRYRGPTWRIDVNRQYTHALRQSLPLRSAFGQIGSDRDNDVYVAVCRVWAKNLPPYPLSVWHPGARVFAVDRITSGNVVCVLHSSEVRCLRQWGCDVEPSYGYRATATFDLAEYVARLQDILTTYGRDDPRSAFCKPLGNYVYGKFGQSSTRTELLYSDENPGKAWWPHWAPDGTAWERVWERDIERVGMTHHVDIAATITAYARAQTALTWLSLSESGMQVVRCHTDSLTVNHNPTDVIGTSGTTIGEWRLEREDENTIVVGPNVYFDGSEAHIAGISQPTYEMIDRLADGNVVHVAQRMKAPRRGFVRGDAIQERALRAGGGQ